MSTVISILPEQITLPLESSLPRSVFNLVPHSGIMEAVTSFESALDVVVEDKSAFRMIYLYGKEGSGKSHLIDAYLERAALRGICAELKVFQLGSENDREDWVSYFISEYERIKSCGGVIIVEAREHPVSAATNPHLQSRLLSGEVIAVNPPLDEEVRLVVESLLARRQVEISEYVLDYLLKRIPRDTLSFSSILARIDELSLRDKKPVGLAIVRKVLDEKV